MPDLSGVGRRLRATLDVRSDEPLPPGRRSGRVWLLDPRRLEILLAAAAYPGLHLRSASRLLLSPLPTLRYHVRILEAHRLLATRRRGTRVHLFVPGMFPATWERLLAAWQDPDGRRTISVLREKGPLSVGKLRSAMGKSPRDLSRTVSWLRRQGVIRMVRSRGELEYGLSQGWVTFERHCRKDTQARLATFLAVLRADDLHPVVESIGGDRARVAVDGRRSRIRFVLPLDPLR